MRGVQKYDAATGSDLGTSRLGSFDQSLFGFFKVDDVPNSFKVVRLHVLVLQVEGVLPNINANDGDMAQERILVSSGCNLKPLGFRVVSQPSPAGSLDGSGSGVELFNERIQSAKVTIDSLLERAGSELSTSSGHRSEIFPEQGVVDVATTVKLESTKESNAFLGRLRGVERGLCSIQAVHVGLVVLLVVESHDLLADVGLKGIVWVRQIGEDVGHGCELLCSSS